MSFFRSFGVCLLMMILLFLVAAFFAIPLTFYVARKCFKKALGKLGAPIIEWYLRSNNEPPFEEIQNCSHIETGRQHELTRIMNRNSVKPEGVLELVLDICVVTFNSEKHLNALFMSIRQQQFPTKNIHLIVVDNKSSDNTILKLMDFKDQFGPAFYDVTILCLKKNIGFGRAHNKGFEHAKGNFFLVTNPDLEFEVGAIYNALKCAYSDDLDKVASWEFRQKPFEHPKIYDPITLKTFWSSGACLLINPKAFKSVGGFDKNIFLYGEDVELSYHFIDSGWDLKYCPQAVVWHYTYKEAGEFKPLQFLGCIKANGLLKIRYGSLSTCLASVFQYPVLFLQQIRQNRVNPTPHYRCTLKLVLKAYMGYMKCSLLFLLTRKRSQFAFPFHGFDYVLTRPGAFYEYKKEPPEKDYLVSIITRTHGDQKCWLREAIASVLNQTYKNIELIVVEDGGDKAKLFIEEIASACSQIKIKYFSLGKVGRSAAGNVGLKAATGDFMMFLDSDDYLFADHIEVLVDELNANKNVGLAYSLAWCVPTKVNNEDNMNEGYTEVSHDLMPSRVKPYDYEQMKVANLFPIQSALFRKEAYEEHGGFDESLDLLEDWELWLRYGYTFQFKLVEKLTSSFRVINDPEEFQKRYEQLVDAAGPLFEKYRAFIESRSVGGRG
jgi:GT2 family glycosyltransferase